MDENANLQMPLKHDNLTNDMGKNQIEQQPKQSSKGFVFGPFNPVVMPKVGEASKNNVKRVQDWESLASFYGRQYHNQALVAAQQRSSNISLGSSLSPSTNSSWLSSSGRFAIGFYPQGNGFAIGIWFAQIPQHTVIWNPLPDDQPYLSSNATLLLTSDGSFILQLTQDQEIDLRDYVGSVSISWASMLDTGNFVLYDPSGEIVWQSFDRPTNTLLPGQSLLPGRELLSRVSETDHSNGRFRLKMQNDGNLVQYPTGTPETAQYAYWSTGTNKFIIGYNMTTLKLDEDGNLYLFDSKGVTIKNLSTGGTPINRTLFYRMTIDVDGIFRVYSINSVDQKSNWSVMWESSTDKCTPKGICGLNSYCSLMDQQAICNCIPGFDFIDESQQSLGCLQKLNAEDCGNEIMSTLEKTEWKDDQYTILSTPTEGECKEACLADSDCEAALFVDQSCRLQKLPLRYGIRKLSTSTLTFIKGRNCSSSTPTFPITLLNPDYPCFYVKLYI
ncbi:G-type lectin S-receptor-like serine/threonine-protein kinase LECRK3 [Macadamia integrifolia]|uniref:G-type lectin S-receptor-like serine/threonine-protein kinase LECRK3 n=1 Tax=Macadamia integrifolia TaxID=60698 RepID=UPI001C501DAE|nr:G-type lectin S-receptor-like serine/threonine-protein kinase LECRK3 [Macadamia integrifolia]